MKIPCYTQRLVLEDSRQNSNNPKSPYALNAANKASYTFADTGYRPSRSYRRGGVYDKLGLFRYSRRRPRTAARKTTCYYCGGVPETKPITRTVFGLLKNRKALTPHCPNCAAA